MRMLVEDRPNRFARQVLILDPAIDSRKDAKNTKKTES
jgi:hypothetical protein